MRTADQWTAKETTSISIIKIMEHNPTLHLIALIAVAAAPPRIRAAVFVSDLSETAHLDSTIDGTVSVAQSFVAGSAATFDAVTLALNLDPPSAGLSVKIYGDVGGVPGASALTDTSVPGAPSRFVPTTPLTLSTGMTYWVVASATASLVRWGGTSSPDQTGISGWTIGDDHQERAFSPLWSLTSDSLRMSVEATAVPEPRDVALWTGAGLLGFAVWRRSRDGRTTAY